MYRAILLHLELPTPAPPLVVKVTSLEAESWWHFNYILTLSVTAHVILLLYSSLRVFTPSMFFFTGNQEKRHSLYGLEHDDLVRNVRMSLQESPWMKSWSFETGVFCCLAFVWYICHITIRLAWTWYLFYMCFVFDFGVFQNPCDAQSGGQVMAHTHSSFRKHTVSVWRTQFKLYTNEWENATVFHNTILYSFSLKNIWFYSTYFFPGDGWLFDLQTKKWTEIQHPHGNKPR